MNKLVVVRGGGDIASGVCYRLKRSGFNVIILETEKPTMVRRTVSFAQAIYNDQVTIEGISCKTVKDWKEALDIMDNKTIPILIDPQGESIGKFKAHILVDAILAKRNIGTNIKMAPRVIALGPGFTAGRDVHAVIETMRGHYLGRVIEEGAAIPNTGIPGDIGGYSAERVLRSPSEGIFKSRARIGELVKKGDIVAQVNEQPIYATISGVLRGLLQDDLEVIKGYKIGDIDPRAETNHCFTISDKALSIAGGVLEAILLKSVKPSSQ